MTAVSFLRTGAWLGLALALAGCAQLAKSPDRAATGPATAEAAAAPDLRRRAFADNALMRFEAAESLYRESALRTGEVFGADAAAQLEQQLYLALNKSNLGELEPAEALFRPAIAGIERSGALVGRVRAAVFYAQHRLNGGDVDGARAEIERAIKLGEAAIAEGAAERGVDGLAPASAAFIIGPDGLEIPPETAKLLNGGEAVKLAAALTPGQLTPREELAILLAQAYYVSAAIARATGTDAAAALAEARGHLEAAPPTNALWLRAELARLSADLALADGDLARAEDESDRAVSIARRYAAGARPEALLRLQQGRIRLEAGDTDGARAAYDRALEIISEGGRGVPYDALAPYLELLVDDPPSQARAETIFLALQTLRDPATSETLARLAARLSAGTSAAADAIRTLQDAERSVNREAAALDRLTAAASRNVNAIRVTRSRLAEAQARLVRARDGVARVAPNFEQIVDSAVALEAFQADLRPGELFFQIRLGSRGGVVAAVTGDSLEFAKIDLGEAEAAGLVGRIRESVYSPFFDLAAAKEIYDRVFLPMQGQLDAADTVIVAPDGPLLSMPPSLFVAGDLSGYNEGSLDYSRVPWLGARKAVTVTLSVASFHHLRQVAPSAAPEPFLGFGGFEPFGPARAPEILATRSAPAVCSDVIAQLGALDPLPATVDEVRRVARVSGAGPQSVRLGSDFTDVALQADDLSQARILHFATHGLLPLSADCLPEPALATTWAPEGDGLLEAGEIVELALDADLVVLSACDTGGRGATSALGTGFRASGGEALSGLVRAFFYAGARNVVASHWLVPDQETATLMDGLYSALRQGESAAEAMRSARSSLAAVPETSHPFYWASFSVIGAATARGGPAGGAAAAAVSETARSRAARALTGTE